jgi:hypothetical protein
MKEIPQWQQDLVLERIEQARLRPEKMRDWDEVSKTLKTDLIKPKSNINDFITKHIKRIKSLKLRKSGHV